MSKMSQLHAELSEQAYDLGFRSIEEAEANGYVVDYENQKLVQSKELQEKNLVEAIDGLDKLQRELEKAHEEWEKEKDILLTEAEELLETTGNFEPTAYDDLRSMVRSLIEFIKEGEI